MKTKNRIYILLFAVFFTPNRSSSQSANKQSPNIIFILTDDQGWSQISSRMHPGIPESKSDYLDTPNMSRLASNGMRFTSGYAPAPICTPTRRAILCGMTPARQKGTAFRSSFIPNDHITIPKALKQADPDYQCAHYGKWGTLMNARPDRGCGYDITDGSTTNITGGVHEINKPCHITEDPKRTGSVTARTIEFISEQVENKNPFYVQVSYYAVHLRIELLEATLEKHKAKGTPDRRYTAAFSGMLEELDRGIGKILRSVEQLGIQDNTYIFFMSDNGGRVSIPGGNDQLLPTNHPLRGSKHTLFEGGIRVPFIVAGPGIRPGSFCHVPVSGVDLLPTFCDLAGGSREFPEEIDGVSIKPLLFGEETGFDRPSGGLFFHNPRGKVSAIRKGDYKLMIHWNEEAEIIRTELFNVARDLTESEDISAREPVKAGELATDLLEYLFKVDARTPGDDIKFW